MEGLTWREIALRKHITQNRINFLWMCDFDVIKITHTWSAPLYMLDANIYNIESNAPRHRINVITYLVIFVWLVFILILFYIVSLIFPAYHNICISSNILCTFLIPHLAITNSIYKRTIVPLRELFIQWRGLRRYPL